MSTTLITSSYKLTASLVKENRAANMLAALFFCTSDELFLCHELFVPDPFQISREGFGSHEIADAAQDAADTGYGQCGAQSLGALSQCVRDSSDQVGAPASAEDIHSEHHEAPDKTLLSRGSHIL